MINFQFDGHDYVVGRDAYEIGVIGLPDGRQLRVDNWYESVPPKPAVLSLTANHVRFAEATREV